MKFSSYDFANLRTRSRFGSIHSSQDMSSLRESGHWTVKREDDEAL